MKIIQIIEQNGYMVGLDSDGAVYQYVQRVVYDSVKKESVWESVGWKPIPGPVLHQEWVE